MRRDATAAVGASDSVAIDRLTEADVEWLAASGVAAIVLAAVVSSSSLGRFGCALALAVALGAIGRAIAVGRLTEAGLARRLRSAVRSQGLVLAGLIVWAEPLMRLLFGARFGAGAATLRLLCVAAFVSPVAWIVTAAVARLPGIRDRLLVSALSCEVGVCATYLLATARGTVGGAAGADALILLCLIGSLWVGRMALDLESPALAHTLVRTVAAATAMAAVMYAVGTRDLTTVGWIGGAAGGAAAYLAVLLATAEVSLTGGAEAAEPGGSSAERLRPPTDAHGSL
jgi:hypothetical protein